MNEYIVHDPEHGVEEEFSDLSKAIKFANECCQDHLDDGWSEEVNNVTVSKVLFRAAQCESISKSDCKPDPCDKNEVIMPNGDNWPNDEWEYICNYKMSEVK